MPSARRAVAPLGRRGRRQSGSGDPSITAVAPSVWRDAVSELIALQGQYAAWLEALPESLQDSATAEALRAIYDLDLTELQAIVPPRGFGRD
jgi:hypothetical protein